MNTVKQNDHATTNDNAKRNRRVLLIEDNQSDSTLIKERILQIWPDADVICANSIFEAYDSYKHSDFDVLVLDLNLQETFGSGSVAELQRINKNRNVPIVVLTGYADSHTLSDAVRKGASHIYKKDDLMKSDFEDIMKKYMQ